MEFRLLGPLEVSDAGRVLEVGGLKQRALLAVLILEANRAVSRDRLVDALWEDAPTPSAVKALQVYVSQLRKVLGGDRVVTTPSGYLLRATPDEIDVARFERLRADGRLHEALALWRGSPLAGFEHQRFAQAEISRLDELRLGALEARIEQDLALGRHAELVGELEALVQAQPLRERLRELQLLALYRCDRQAEALAAYQAAREALVGGLGIEPGKRLRELQQAVLRQDAALDLRKAVVERAGELFVGRDRELAELAASLDDAIAGRGRLVLVVGEPGIGKSRLAEELIAIARSRHVRVRVGRCWEVSGAPPYWPWVDALREDAVEAPPDVATLLRGESLGSESETARFRLAVGLARFLRRLSAQKPLLLFLDDVHAADDASLLLLQFVARELAGARLLVVAACRDVDPVPGRQLSALLADVARRPETIRLSLRGISEAAVAEYVTLAARNLASPELIAALFEGSEGNPLFLSESVRLLATEGTAAIPETVRDVISRRLARLSSETLRALETASVAGRVFSLEVVARMSGIGEEALLDALEEAGTARILSATPGDFRFAHMVIRDVLYDGLTAPRRLRLHRAAVRALVQTHGTQSGPHLAELVHHALAANDFARAHGWAKAAADRALDLLAYEEAARLYGVALDSLERARPGEIEARCELLISLGEAEARSGRSAAAKESSWAAAVLARRPGLEQQFARAAAAYGDAARIVWARAGDDHRLVPLLEQALDVVGDDVGLRSRLLARLAGALRDEHSRQRRDALSREAVELARSIGNPAALSYALVGRAHAITAPDTIDEYLQLADELFRVAVSIDDKERIVASHMLRIMGLHMLGEIDAARTHLVAVEQIARELRQPSHLWEVEGVKAMLALAEGRFVEAATLVEAAFARGEEAMPEPAATHRCMQSALLHEFTGGLEDVEPGIRSLARNQPSRLVFRCALAHAHALLGRMSAARRLLAGLVHDGVVDIPFDQEWPLGVALLAETAELTEDVQGASTLYEALRPWRHLTATDQSEGCRGSLERYLGLLALTLGIHDRAEEHFLRALEANEEMEFGAWVGRTEEDYARLLRLRGDHDRADALERAARTTYAALGAHPRIA